DMTALAEHGAVVLWDPSRVSDDDATASLERTFPMIEMQSPLLVRWHTPANPPPLRILWGIIRPASRRPACRLHSVRASDRHCRLCRNLHDLRQGACRCVASYRPGAAFRSAEDNLAPMCQSKRAEVAELYGLQRSGRADPLSQDLGISPDHCLIVARRIAAI